MNVLHANESFSVEVDDLGTGYWVRNKLTAVIEFKDPQIANVITYAEHGNAFLNLKLWRAVGIQAKANAEFLDAQPEPVADLYQP